MTIETQREGKIYTLNDNNLFIDTKYFKEEQISTSTISKILKLKHGVSYKRMTVLNSSINMKENFNKIIEILSIQAKLLKNNRNVLFLDEFKYWSKSTKFFWWCVKNKNAFFQKPIDKFDLGFMIAYSKDEIKAVTATKAIYTSEHFKWFLLKLIENNSEDTSIFMDNASIHKVSSIMELCKMPIYV